MTRKEIDNEIVRLFTDDFSVRQIAEKLAVTTEYVKKRLYAMRKEGREIKRWYKQ